MNKEKIDKAIARITTQALEFENEVATAVEEHLVNLCTNDEIADALLNEDKSMDDFMNKLEAKVKEKVEGKRSGTAMVAMAREDVFKFAEEYFEIDSLVSKPGKFIDVTDLL